MKVVKLVALISGVGKTGKTWYRAILKGNKGSGEPVVTEHWLTESVGRAAMASGLREDEDIRVLCDLDEFLKPAISGILPANDGDVVGVSLDAGLDEGGF